MTPRPAKSLPEPIRVVTCDADIATLLSREWLITNRLGTYASGTVIGCNTRRYHGLLIAATTGPMGRIAALATVTEEAIVGEPPCPLGCHEFLATVATGGLEYLVEFRNDVAPTFVYQIGPVRLTKEIMLAESANTVAVRYTVTGGSLALRVRPLVALRDFHHLRRAEQPGRMLFEHNGPEVVVRDDALPACALYLVSQEATFVPGADWWHSFHYRVEAARGQDAGEDLYTPGVFEYALADGQSCQFTASLDEPLPLGFGTTCQRRGERLADLVAGVGPSADETTQRLAMATDAFIARRDLPDGPASWTILAGYPWFADWGRDAFIALPGLLLSTGRFDTARQIFTTFAASMRDGMVPNRFDDRTRAAHYNAIDASLWFIVSADQYVRATGDTDFARDVLAPVATTILNAYHAGTLFDIHAEADGLLVGGGPETQLTWMDAALGPEAVTSRHGKAVEVNALWYSAHRAAARYCAKYDATTADTFSQRAAMIGAAFNRTFWNAAAGCCYDCVYSDQTDAAVRPNQIFAVSLPYSPLPPDRARSVVQCVSEKLLTPYGLRTLAPDEPGYCGTCIGSPEYRDRAYHQGTVWAFLLGPFIEAYLKVNAFGPLARAQARHWLLGLEDHLYEAGLGTISEIFDGDAPHCPRGCIAQAWSVGEILRARMLATGPVPQDVREDSE